MWGNVREDFALLAVHLARSHSDVAERLLDIIGRCNDILSCLMHHARDAKAYQLSATVTQSWRRHTRDGS